MKKQKINKAREVVDPNKYIWIKTTEDKSLITDSDVVLNTIDKSRGIANYYKGDETNVIVWRFARSKGWEYEAALTYVLSTNPSKSLVDSAYEHVTEFKKGNVYLSAEKRAEIFKHIEAFSINNNLVVPKLVSQKVYKNMSDIKDKMKKLAELSNVKFQEFMEVAQDERLKIVKSEVKKEVEKQGFKFHGVVTAYKSIRKSEDGTESESWRLRTTFTSNQADLHWDVTSRKAIESCVEKLKEKGVAAIRFEHEQEDYGVWDTFRTYEREGILYGEAEGELDQHLARSKDLWYEIYELGKQFATSYGGYWIDYHWYQDDAGNIVRVFDDIEVEEISLTTRPANPDTAMDALNKYASKLERSINLDNDSIMKVKESLKKSLDTEVKKEAPVEPEKKEEVAETTEETVVEPAAEQAPSEEPATAEEPKAEETASAEEPASEEPAKEGEDTEKSKANDSETSIAKALGEIAKAMSDISKSQSELSERVAKLEQKPSARKSVSGVVEKKEVAASEDPNSTDKNAEKLEQEFAKSYPMMNLLRKGMGMNFKQD